MLTNGGEWFNSIKVGRGKKSVQVREGINIIRVEGCPPAHANPGNQENVIHNCHIIIRLI